MNLDVVLHETLYAHEALGQRDSLPRAHRLFLILVDGCESIRDLLRAAQKTGVDHRVLASLANAVLVHWMRNSDAGEGAAPPPLIRSSAREEAIEHLVP